MPIDRGPYEFDDQTIRRILFRDNFSCVDCGRHKSKTDEGYVEIDHVLPIWFAATYLPAACIPMIRSAANGESRCRPCHKEKHRREDFAAMKVLAQAMFGIVVEE